MRCIDPLAFPRGRGLAPVAALATLAALAFAAPSASAQCSPDGKICPLTDISRSLEPAAYDILEFRLPPEATEFRVSPGVSWRDKEFDYVGFSVWRVRVLQTRDAAPVALSTHAIGPGLSSTATFRLSFRSAVDRLKTRLVSRPDRYEGRAIYHSRVGVQALLSIRLDTSPRRSRLITLKTKRATKITGGPHELKLFVPRSRVRKRCRHEAYCRLIVTTKQWFKYYGVKGSEVFVRPSATRHFSDSRIIKR